MGKENLVCNTIRLNMNIPQHVKINEILCSINKDICKSKNQFIIDAIEFYVEYYGKEMLVKEEIDAIKQDLMEAAMTEARNEVIRVLGTAIAGRGIVQIAPAVAESEDNEEQKELVDDEVLSGLASGWMAQDM